MRERRCSSCASKHKDTRVLSSTKYGAEKLFLLKLLKSEGRSDELMVAYGFYMNSKES
jgi:hypothetical protein